MGEIGRMLLRLANSLLFKAVLHVAVSTLYPLMVKISEDGDKDKDG